MDTVDKINIRLKKILEYTGYLKKYQGITAEKLKNDFEKRASVERYFQLTIESVIDIANLINAEYRFRPAQDAKESIVKSERTDLLEGLEKELAILTEYLPKPLEEAQVLEIINAVISELSAVSMKDMGKVMKEVLTRIGVRANSKKVSNLVKEKLSS